MDKKSILKQIKSLINFSTEHTFKDAKLIDGETIIQVEGDVYEVGKQLSVVTPDGLMPAPVGDHTTIDGDKITVDEKGIITAVEKVEVQAPEEAPVEASAETEDFYTWDQCMLDMMDEYDDEQIASAVCGKIKADGYIMSKEEAFAEASQIAPEKNIKPEQPVAEEDMKKKIQEMENKIADIEKMVSEMLPVVKKSAEFSNDVMNKLDTFVQDTPAQIEFASIKSEYKDFVKGKKEQKTSGLESIKNLRKK